MTLLEVAILTAWLCPPEAGPIAQLGSPSYVTREQAAAKLRTAGMAVVPACEFWATAHPCSETRGRCKAIALAYFDVRPTGGGNLPWLADPIKEYAVRETEYQDYLDQAERQARAPAREMWQWLFWWNQPEECEEGLDMDFHWREATRLWAEDRLRAGVSREEVVRLLNRMAEIEAEWKRERR
jgi:hypothetical protein